MRHSDKFIDVLRLVFKDRKLSFVVFYVSRGDEEVFIITGLSIESRLSVKTISQVDDVARLY